jgi:uncharacterized protein
MILANIQRPILASFMQRLAEPAKFIQVLWGPRQVGKTTLVQQASTLFTAQMQGVAHYASSDAAPEPDMNWLQAQWQTARLKTQAHIAKSAAAQASKGSNAAPPQGLLILDEIQRVRDWPRHVKALWDEDRASKLPMHVVLLGSSPAAIQKGISESLAGRFEQTWLGHWSLAEVQAAFGATVDEYVYYGGYPGAYALKNQNTRWRAYVRDALLETAISRDVLQLASVEKPALLRQLAHLTTHYSGQLLSYTKMLGSLQDAGNATTLAHYLHLLEAAGLMTGLQKFAGDVARQRGSIPKLLVLNTALISASHELSFTQARQNAEHWGRLVESCIGAHLWNLTRSSATATELTYWRERSSEVDFCVRTGDRLVGVEVKSGKKRERAAGLASFAEQFGASSMMVGTGGLPVEEFLNMPPEIWLGSSD